MNKISIEYENCPNPITRIPHPSLTASVISYIHKKLVSRVVYMYKHDYSQACMYIMKS